MYQQLSQRINNVENTTSNSIASALDAAYPIGSIYISYSSTNPGTLFGGTWTAFGTGKTLVGIDTSDTDFDTIGETGGNKTVVYTPAGTVGNHTLTEAELPVVTGSIYAGSGNSSSGLGIFRSASGVFSTRMQTAYAPASHTSGWASIATNYPYQYIDFSLGSGNAHNHPFTGTQATLNVQNPYITVYMWRRTA